MLNLRHTVSRFALSEGGAVTVDWVVLTGALCGLGIAVLAVVSSGVEQQSRAIAGLLTGVEIQTQFAEALEEAGFALLDFADGISGFTGGEVVTFPELGEVFQIGPNDTASASFAMPEGATEATVEFDLMGLDTLNGESAVISINGEVAGTVTVDHGTAVFHPTINGVTSFEAHNSVQGTDVNGDGTADSVTQIRLTTTQPGENLQFEVYSGASAQVANESFAIDNVNVSAN